MSVFFRQLNILSAYSKWTYIQLFLMNQKDCLITPQTLIEAGCPRLKVYNIIKELLKFGALKKVRQVNKKQGSSFVRYSFIIDDKAISTSAIAKVSTELKSINTLRLMIPVELVWFYLKYNQSEFGYVKNVNIEEISINCSLKETQVLNALKTLQRHNLIISVINKYNLKGYKKLKSKKHIKGIRADHIERPAVFKIISPCIEKLIPIDLTYIPSCYGHSTVRGSYLIELIFSVVSDNSDLFFAELLKLKASDLDEEECKKLIRFLDTQTKSALNYLEQSMCVLISKGLTKLFRGGGFHPINNKMVNDLVFGQEKFEFSNSVSINLFVTLIKELSNLFVHYYTCKIFKYSELTTELSIKNKEQLKHWVENQFINSEIDFLVSRNTNDYLVLSSNMSLQFEKNFKFGADFFSDYKLLSL